MQIHARHYWSALAVLILTAPVWAHTDTAKLTVTETTSIGGTELKPGEYNLEVKDNQTQLKVIEPESGKTVAEVPCRWIQLQQKPGTSRVVVDNNQLTEVDFGGKTQAVQIANR